MLSFFASVAVATSGAAVVFGVSLWRLIRNLAMGPPMRLARISPKVAQAMPISMALEIPWSAAIRGAQAMAVPCPPTRDTEPPSMPTADGRPISLATEMPVRFWTIM